MTLVVELVEEVMERRPRLYVDRLMCHGPEICRECWWCREGQSGRYIMGTGRITDVTHGTRRAVTVIEPEPAPYREEELAAPWLRRVLAQGRGRGMADKRVPWQKMALAHLELLPPRFFSGGPAEGEWAYVDVVQAYPSIYRRLALDMIWRPDPDRPLLGTGGMSMACPEDFLEWKSTHRAIGGIIRSTQMSQVVNGRSEVIPTVGWSKFLAPDLWGVIMWTLHSIARMAVEEFGAVMWDTDGGIVPRDRSAGLREAVRDRWRLSSRSEFEGPGTVWGVKHWRIGDHETAQDGKHYLAAEDRVLQVSQPVAKCLQAALS